MQHGLNWYWIHRFTMIHADSKPGPQAIVSLVRGLISWFWYILVLSCLVLKLQGVFSPDQRLTVPTNSKKEDFFAFDHRSIAGTCIVVIVAMGCWMLAIWDQTQTGCVAKLNKLNQISNMSQLEMQLFDVKTTNVISLAAWLCWCLLTHFQTNTDKPKSWLVDAER